ncbi:MAG: 50S ribosomal protein L25 [bacterium]|nr:50S ribosomal protein L25 [bacterium]
MAESTILQAELRSEKGKQVAKHLRQTGHLPAVVYGEGGPPMACTVDRKQLENILHAQGRNAIVALSLAGNTQNTIIKELQHHPLVRGILHVDFHRISLTEKIVVEVAVDAVGIPAGVRNDGGILEHMLHSIDIECLPTEIPEKITFDVSGMQIGDTIHVSDLVTEGDITIVTEGDRSVFVVVPPTVLKATDEEDAEEAETEMQEPEVIERGKRDEDEDGEDDDK